MASISNDPNGRRRIQFISPSGQRKTIYLGKASLRYAESVRTKVEDLVCAAMTGHPPADATSRWLNDLDHELYDKLAKVGLAKARAKATLGGFIDGYVEKRSDVKPSTRQVYDRVRRYLVGYFGEDKSLREITPGDADAWRWHLKETGLSDNTIRKSCGLAKQWFTAAVRSKLVQENPFAGLTGGVKANASRFYFVTRQQAERVIEACPDVEWQLLFALARYGGLRVPSGALCLRWADIDWRHDRFTVTSSKTEHHEGHGSRIVPIFPELKRHLLDAFELAEPGEPYCIMRYRDTTANLRTQLQRIIKRAGLEPWPKLWQNLRSTRETELADQFPAHVVSAWIGNSVAVAVKHYLQITDAHFDRAAAERADNQSQRPNGTSPNRATEAAEPSAGSADVEVPTLGQPNAQAAHNPTQKRAVAHGKTQQTKTPADPASDITPDVCETFRQCAVACGPEDHAESGPWWTRTTDLLDVNEAR